MTAAGGTILDRLADHARERVEEAKRRMLPAEIRQEALDKDAACFERLFREIDAWLTEEDRQAGCFWILGI